VPQTEQLASIPLDGTELSASSTFGERIDFAKAFLRRRYLVILTCLLLSAPFAALYLISTPPTYTASATMLIESQSNLLARSLFGSDMRLDAAWMESQIGIIKSQLVAAYVVKQLRLADDPRFTRPEPGLLERIMIRFGRKPPEAKSEGERTNQAILAVMGGLDARRVGQSYVMSINASWSSPDQAVRIANSIVDGYLFDQLNAKFQASRRAADWLQERLQVLREQSAAAERAVIEFKSKNNLVSAGNGTLMNGSDKQLSDINAQLAGLYGQIYDQSLRLERVDAVRQAFQEDQPPPATIDETIAEITNNGIVNGYRMRYLDLVNREADWAVRYGKNHIAVVNLRKQIREIRTSMRDEMGRIEENAKTELELTKKRVADLEKKLAPLLSQSGETNHSQIALFSLEAQAQSYRRIYDTFLQQHTEIVQQQSLPISDARVVTPASGGIQTAPKALQAWIVTIFAGGMLGVGLGALREIMDRGFRTGEQVRSILDTECLALVPLLSRQRAIAALPQSLAALPIARHFAPRRIDFTTSNILRTITDAPSSPYAEAIRALKVTIDLNREVRGHTNVIGLTSCHASEGKSSVAAAMAALIAKGGARAILVDCDLRNPSLSRALTPEAGIGFIEVVLGKVPLADAVWTDPTTNMAFLPAVANPGLPHATEVLASQAAKTLFGSLQAQYDYVIVDLAPLLAAVDVRAASRLVGGYVLVIEWGTTKVDEVQHALRLAPGVQANVVGAVLNKVNMVSLRRYDGYGSRYYYGQPRQTGAMN
jgi:succinoglycan biosynthesis transport protein ExoP